MGMSMPANTPDPPAILEPFAAPIIAAEGMHVERGAHTIKCHVLIKRNRPEGGFDWIVMATVIWHPSDYEDAVMLANASLSRFG